MNDKSKSISLHDVCNSVNQNTIKSFEVIVIFDIYFMCNKFSSLFNSIFHNIIFFLFWLEFLSVNKLSNKIQLIN